ncbi:hypothetical protein QJS04_geneDACA005386 [Acorus gramineus]|uniref:Uncharacterized protein n=1 Tax=Acorus gramineus TaxID=55184 RepID=A0AAV9AXQ6_ACOGR|nr:hypothetical protein QJS04_geneDACA005386 [Acorus gramineus]
MLAVNSLDHLGLQQSFEHFQLNPKTPVPDIQDGGLPNLSTLSSQVFQDAGNAGSSGPPYLLLPHQIFENAAQLKVLGATSLQKVEGIQLTESLSIPVSEVTEKYLQEDHIDLKKHTIDPENSADAMQVGVSLDKEADVFAVSAAMESCTPPEENATISIGRSGKIETSISGQAEMEGSSGSIHEESQMQREKINIDSLEVTEVRNVEGREAKKATDKKSRKQKNLKAQPTIDGGKGLSNTSSGQQDIEIEGREAGGSKSETIVRTYKMPHGIPVENGVHLYAPAQVSQQVQPHLSRSTSGSKVETGTDKAEVRELESESLLNAQVLSGHRAWKPSPGLKPKSLLEIQQEEQKRAQTA